MPNSYIVEKMGVCADGNIYGVQWTLYVDNADGTRTITVLFNRKYPQKLTTNQIQEIEFEWNQLTQEEKGRISIKFYTRIIDTYEIGGGGDSGITLWPGDRIRLLELFATGDTTV